MRDRTVSREDEQLAIKYGVWITPKLEGCVFGNRRSINKFTGEQFLIGNINWLKSEFNKMGISYTILSE